MISCKPVEEETSSEADSPAEARKVGPLASLTLQFTTDYKATDNYVINFTNLTGTSSLGSTFGIPQSDATILPSGTTYNIALKVRPYYALDNITAGTVATEISPATATSTIPDSNQLAINSNNKMSFTATGDGGTYTYNITLSPQAPKVSVDILNSADIDAYGAVQISATTNSVNHFVNMFLHNSATTVTYATALRYTSRATAILTHGETGNDTKYWFTHLAATYDSDWAGLPTSDSTSSSPYNNNAVLPTTIALQPSTQYWLHVYYKDLAGTEIKEVYPFTTQASIPTAAMSTATATDYAHTWARANGGYVAHNPMPASTDATRLNDANIRYFDTSTKGFVAKKTSDASISATFNYAAAAVPAGYQYSRTRLLTSANIRTTSSPLGGVSIELSLTSGTSFSVCSVFVCSSTFKIYVNTLATNVHLSYLILSINNIFAAGGEIEYTSGGTLYPSLYTLIVADSYLWVTTPDGSAPIRPIQ